MLHLQLTPETERILADVSARTGDTPEHLAQRALLAYLEDLEDYAAAVEAWKHYDLSKTIAAEELLREFGVEP